MNHTILNQQFSTESLKKDQLAILEDFDKIIQGVRPLNSRQLQALPDNIRQLSHQLTDQRSTRRLGYMNENVQLSAYVRYFTWWNLVRLTRLFSNLPASAFPSTSAFCLDLGSGPLTAVTALWIARPELRNLKLTWYCLDISQASMAFGEDVFMSVAAKLPPQASAASANNSASDSASACNSSATNATSNATNASSTRDSNVASHWKIIRVKGSFGTSIREKCSFVTCANMFNELDQNSQMPPEFQTKKYFEQLCDYATPDARFLLVEPGVPKAARTLSLLRDRFLGSGYSVLAPCPHALECPMNGFKSYTGSKNKWCNFAFSTEDAPKKLQKLSVLSKLPKERAVLSFICVEKGRNAADNSRTAGQSQKSSTKNSQARAGNTMSYAASKAPLELTARITSDPFRLPKNRTGFYACSELGLTLIATEHPEQLKSGTLLQLQLKKAPDTLPADFKSGAPIIFI